MSLGNGNPKSGNKGSNHNFENRQLIALGQLIQSVVAGTTDLAKESTLVSVLNAIIASDQDIEILLVRQVSTGDVLQQITNYETGTPVVTYKDVNGNVIASPGTVEYLDPSAVLNLILTELQAQGLTLNQIQLNTDNLEALLTTIDTVLDNSLVQLQAINANTDQLEALSTDIKNLLTAIDADTSNIATDIAAIEVLITTTNSLLTTIDAVLDQIQTNTLNTVNELTTANVTLNDIEGELISLNSTAGTLATEATLELVRLQLVALNATDFATEATVSTLATQATLAAQAADIATIEANIALLNAKFNTFGREPEATSTPFAIDQEAYNALLAIQTAVQNIDSDLGTGGLALETTQEASRLILVAIDTILAQIYTNLQLNTIETINIKNNTDAMVVDLAAIEVLITNTNALLTTIDGVLDAIKLDTANLDVALSTRLNTLGRKAETASAPVVLSDEDFASLEAIRVAVQNLDVDVDGIATEVTLSALLTAFNAEDFATETTLASLAGTDFATQTTLAALLTAFNAEDFASQTTLQALLTAFNAEDFSTETTLAALLAAFNAEDFATETTLSAINTTLTATARVHNTVVATGITSIGVVPAGSLCGSVINTGNAAGVWNGVSLPAGVSIPWSPIGAARDTYGAIAYDATGTTFIIEYTT